MSDIPIFTDKARYSITEQINILSQSNNSNPQNPFVVGHLNHSHTEPEDFLKFSQNGASILVNCSGITLHNLAARNAINRLAVRPILLWAYEADKTQQYLVGEEVEAAVTGSDGILYRSGDLFKSELANNNGQYNGSANNLEAENNNAILKFNRCHTEGLSSVVALESYDHLSVLINLPTKPTAVFTFDDNDLAAATSLALRGSSVVHIHLNTITPTQPLDVLENRSRIFVEDVNLLSKQEEMLSQIHTNNSSRSGTSTITSLTPPDNTPLVKVCGIKTVEAAQKALESGADMIGMIMVPGRSRTVDIHEAKKIVDLVHNFNRSSTTFTPTPPPRRLSVISSTTSLLQKAAHLANKDSSFSTPSSPTSTSSTSLSHHHGQISRRGSSQAIYPPWPSLSNIPSGASVFEVNSRIVRAKTRRKPAVVGVFQNQPLEAILSLQHDLNLDYVQLHGDEPLEWCRIIPTPVIKRFTPNTSGFANCSLVGYHYIALLDGEVGGEGKLVDWSATKAQVALGARFILAGGLTEHNVVNALQTEGVFGVDVSGGVETSGSKDLGKIERFVKAAKSVDSIC